MDDNLDSTMKKTEIGLLPQEWEVKTLDELTMQVGSGVTPRGGRESYLSHGVPLIRSQNVLMNGLDLSDVAFIAEETHSSMGRSSLNPGDVLLNITGASIGRVAVVPDSLLRANVNQHVCKLRLKPEAHPPFVCFYLSTEMGQSQILGSQYGATRQGLNFGQVRQLRLPLPPLAEQQAIARVLGTVQQAKEATEKVLAAAHQLKQSLMRHLFTYGPVPIDQADKVPLKETEAGEVPEHWVEGRFDQFAILQRGFDITKQEQRPGAVPVVSSSGIKSYHDTACVKGPGVVVGRKGSLGTAHYVEADFWPHDTALWVKDFKGNHPRFLYYFLPTLNLKSLDTGTSNPTLNRNYVHALQVALPPIDEQRLVSEFLHHVDRKMEAEEKKASGLNALFQTLLHNLMTGKVRVHDLPAFSVAGDAHVPRQ